MNKVTRYGPDERSAVSATMPIPSLGNKRITFTQYSILMRVMGLQRDPDNIFWLGGWPVFLLPNGEMFLLDFGIKEYVPS